MKKTLFRFIATAAIVGGGLITAHAADNFPTKPIRLIVGFAAGGPTDIIARVIAKDM